MTHTRVMLAAAAILSSVLAHAQSPCSLLTPDQIQAVINTPVKPGEPGGSKDSPDCTWRDTKGQDRVYLSLKSRQDFHDTRAAMQSTGHMEPVTGLGEDAFFVASTGSDAALYALGKSHLLLLTVSGRNASKQENEAAERSLAAHIVPRL